MKRKIALAQVDRLGLTVMAAEPLTSTVEHACAAMFFPGCTTNPSKE